MDNLESLTEEVTAKPKVKKNLAKKGGSGSNLSKANKPPTRIHTKPLAIRKKQGSNTVPHSSADQEAE